MKSLHLLRHAKSSWKDPGRNDHDRPLSKRGRQTAKMMAAYLRRAKIAPDLVICSTAMRARQTLDPITKAKKPPKVVLEREIYGGAQRELWEQLWNLPESAKSVLLIGHNPALQDLALELAHADLNKLPASAGGKFPTGAIAVEKAWISAPLEHRCELPGEVDGVSDAGVLAQFFGPEAINDRLILIETVSFTTTPDDMLDSLTRIIADRAVGAAFFGNYHLMDYELMGGDARQAIIDEDTKRKINATLPPQVPWGSHQWPMLITPGPGAKTLADLP
jgi:phosphohistidine phosphatase SixA